MHAPLPIESIRPAFERALGAGPVVVEAATGSGKSTRVPLWCLNHGRTLVVEPRRLACRALARHVAELDGSTLGGRIGYAVRFDSAYGPETGAVFVTPGIALRWLAEDGLAGFETVVLDEFHERRWDTDLLLALLHHAGGHRLVLTSATLDAAALARYLDGERLRAEGRSFPVDIEYREDNTLPRLKDLAPRVAGAVTDALARFAEGDVLVFLPGRREIRQAQELLAPRVDTPVHPLHAGVTPAEQDRLLRPAGQRRVILATNVAETSLTIPSVRVVVDSGLERRTHHRNGRTVLGLHPIAAAAADQRAGRAGRVGPGHCLRLWGRQAKLEPFTPPEVAREELTDLLLAAAAAGVGIDALRFPEPLPVHAVERARERLRRMQAIDAEDRLTDHGRRLFPLPLDPLFAHLITAMPDVETRTAMIDLSAALGAGGRLLAPPRSPEAVQTLKSWAPEACDTTTAIRLVRDDPPAPLQAQTAAVKEARRVADQVRRELGLPPRRPAEPLPREGLLRAAAAAAPELVFVRRAKRRHALGNGDSEVEPADESRLGEEAEAALVFDTHSIPARGTNRTLNIGTCLAPIPLSWLEAFDLGELEFSAPQWEDGTLVVKRRRVYAGRVVDERESTPSGAVLREGLAELILRGKLKAPAGPQLIDDTEAWNLYLAVGWGEGEPADARAWLTRRLTELGVEQAEDMELIEPADLAFDGIPAWERQRFDEKFPRRVDLSNLGMQVHYDPARRRVTVEREKQSVRRKPPQRRELPAWSGWRVFYRDASRVMELI